MEFKHISEYLRDIRLNESEWKRQEAQSTDTMFTGLLVLSNIAVWSVVVLLILGL